MCWKKRKKKDGVQHLEHLVSNNIIYINKKPHEPIRDPSSYCNYMLYVVLCYYI